MKEAVTRIDCIYCNLETMNPLVMDEGKDNCWEIELIGQMQGTELAVVIAAKINLRNVATEMDSNAILVQATGCATN